MERKNTLPLNLKIEVKISRNIFPYTYIPTFAVKDTTKGGHLSLNGYSPQNVKVSARAEQLSQH